MRANESFKLPSLFFNFGSTFFKLSSYALSINNNKSLIDGMSKKWFFTDYDTNKIDFLGDRHPICK